MFKAPNVQPAEFTCIRQAPRTRQLPLSVRLPALLINALHQTNIVFILLFMDTTFVAPHQAELPELPHASLLYFKALKIERKKLIWSAK